MVRAATSDCSRASGDGRSDSAGTTIDTAAFVKGSQEQLSPPLAFNSAPRVGDSQANSRSVAVGTDSTDPPRGIEGGGVEHGGSAEESKAFHGTTSASSRISEEATVAAQAVAPRSADNAQGYVAPDSTSSNAILELSDQAAQPMPIDMHGPSHAGASADLSAAARGTRGGAESPKHAVSVNAQIALSKGPEVQAASHGKTGQFAEISLERGDLREIPESGRIRVIGRGASVDGPVAARVISSPQLAETIPEVARRAQQQAGFDSRSMSRTSVDPGAAKVAQGSHQQTPELLSMQPPPARASSSSTPSIGQEPYTGRSNPQGGSQLNVEHSVDVDGLANESDERATRKNPSVVATSRVEQPQGSRESSFQAAGRGSASLEGGAQMSSGGESAGGTTVKSQPVVEVEGARPARVQTTNNGNQPGRTEWVTLRLDDVNGEAARVRVAVRGDTVRTTIMHPNESVVENLRAHLPDLQQALAREGLTSARLGVQSATVAPNSGAQNTGGAPGGSSDGGNGSQSSHDKGGRDGFNQHRERDDVSRDREESNNRQRSRRDHER